MVRRVFEGDDDMQAHEVWEYDYKGTAPGGNMYNCALRTNETVNALKTQVAEINSKLAKIQAGGATVDYDKLANKVADVIYARMKQ